MVLTVDMDNIPQSVAAKFGSPNARPRVLRTYDPHAGWMDRTSKAFLTLEVAAELKAAGITLVVAKWKRQLHQISLLHLELPPR